MANVILICEGATDGLDIRALNAVIAQKLGKQITIRAAGGDRGLGSVATYLEEQSKQQYGGTSDEVFTIEDRNYKSWTEAHDSWGQNNKRLIWHRHEIENYLLDPGIVVSAFDLLNKIKPASLPQSRPDVESLLHSCANKMLEDHAGWLTYYYYLVSKLGPLRLRLSGLGGILQTRQNWIEHLQQECSRLSQATLTMSQIAEFDAPEIENFYDQKLDEIRQPSFLTSGQYLRDLRGKELLGTLYERVKTMGFAKMKKADFQEKLIQALGQEYSYGYFDPDDFDELAKRLE
jgi:hypothetical protein